MFRPFLKIQKGFALLEVFLAVIVISIITIGSYDLISHYRSAGLVQSVEGEVMNMALAYSPMLNQAAMTEQPPVIDAGSGKMSVSFLKSVPITAERMATPQAAYSYVLTGLPVSGGNSAMGFADIQTSDTPTMEYFVSGFTAHYSQLSQLIQAMNNNVGVFIGNANALTSLKSASPLSRLDYNMPKDCPEKNCTYAVYLVSPKIDTVDYFRNDFTAPVPIQN